MRTIILTGAGGFIGYKTAQSILEKGHRIIGIDNVNDYYDIRLKNYRINVLNEYSNFSFYKHDIEEINGLEQIFESERIDSVIHLAARAGVRYSLKNPAVYLTTNALGTLNILELMKKKKIQKMVLASTSSLYAGQPLPFTEELPVNTPISPYAATKKAAEVLAYSYHYLFDLDVTVVRYFTVYGPAGRPDMSIFRFIKWIDEGKPIKLYGDGSQKRDFTYIDDIADGTIKALKNVGFEIINLGGGRNPISLNYVIKKIEQLLGKKAVIDQAPFKKEDIEVTWADIKKAKQVLDWEPKVQFEEGLRRTVEWHNDNRHWLQSVSV